MKKLFVRPLMMLVFVCFAVVFVVQAASAQQSEGEKIFKTVCFACHTIGKGRLVGPDLANVHKRRSEEWILRFVRSSKSVIESGDEYAVKLFAEYNRIPMPDQSFSDAQIRSIIAYLAANSPDDGSTTATRVAEAMRPPEKPATEEDIRSGQDLFTGARRFENGGAVCVSCHNVNRSGVAAGGTLARDLTKAHSRLGEAGVKAVLTNPPFPAMNKAFDGAHLTSEEIFQVTAFLRSVDSVPGRGPHYGARLFFLALGGAIVILGLFSGVWLRGKIRSVNHAIYERQVKATWKAMSDTERIG